jgi:hypothetical protein
MRLNTTTIFSINNESILLQITITSNYKLQITKYGRWSDIYIYCHQHTTCLAAYLCLWKITDKVEQRLRIVARCKIRIADQALSLLHKV